MVAQCKEKSHRALGRCIRHGMAASEEVCLKRGPGGSEGRRPELFREREREREREGGGKGEGRGYSCEARKCMIPPCFLSQKNTVSD